jgi:hypothetical protein
MDPPIFVVGQDVPPLLFVFLQWNTVPPSPRLSSALIFSVPPGLVVHPSMAVSTHHAVRRPMMVWERGARFSAKLGPLPAQKGGLQRATWIHLTFRNLSCFHSVRFS